MLPNQFHKSLNTTPNSKGIFRITKNIIAQISYFAICKRLKILAALLVYWILVWFIRSFSIHSPSSFANWKIQNLLESEPLYRLWRKSVSTHYITKYYFDHAENFFSRPQVSFKIMRNINFSKNSNLLKLLLRFLTILKPNYLDRAYNYKTVWLNDWNFAELSLNGTFPF